MQSSSSLILLSAVFAVGMTAPIFDLFPGFISDFNLNSPQKEDDVVKRHTVDANPDAELKQVSLNALIGDLEHNFVQSAISASQANHDQATVPEIRPAAPNANADDHSLNKRDNDAKVSTGDSLTPAAPTPATAATTTGAKILIQTTKKIPETDTAPAHILIDRVAVQPHVGGLPLIPNFEVHHTKVISATVKDASDGAAAKDGADTQTKISISKTIIKGTVEGPEPSSTSTTASSPTTSASSITTEKSDHSTSTTPKEAHDKHKEAEEKLKEKVAEIEAEPVILSARV